MTKKELIEKLAGLPDDTEVMIERGEWGPSRIKEARPTEVYDAGTVHNWEVMFPSVADDPDDYRRISVVLLG